MTASSEAWPGAFITGTGRVGSTLMSAIIRAHPQALSLSEVFMSMAAQAFAYHSLDGKDFWRLLSEPTAATREVFTPQGLPTEYLFEPRPDGHFSHEDAPPILRAVLPHLSDDPEPLYFELEPVIRARPRAPIGAHYRFLFDWLTARQGKRLWIERSGGSVAFLPSLIEHFPGARFVHLFRDGRETAISITQHPGMRIFVLMRRRLKRVGIDILRKPFLLASNRPGGFAERYCGPLLGYKSLITEPVSPAEAGAFWSDAVLIGLENWRNLPEARRFDLRYEDLVADPAERLRATARYIDPGLEDEAWLAAAAALPEKRPERWRDLPKPERDALETACAPGLEALGYR